MITGDHFQQIEKMISDNISSQESIREFIKETLKIYDQKISLLQDNIEELHKIIDNLKLKLLQYEQRIIKCERTVGLDTTKENILC